MITTEAEIRVALQAVLVTMLAFNGFWGWALLVLAVMLPWKPLFAVGSYLAQPVVDWRSKKALERHERGMAQIEQELDTFLRTPKGAAKPAEAALPATPAASVNPPLPKPLEAFKPSPTAEAVKKEIPETAQNLAATLEIPTIIENHVRTLPQGVFSNMNLEVEEIQFRGDSAEANVRFQSPSVKGLVIRQRYVLRRTGDHWEVESREPANGASKLPHSPSAINRPPMQLA